MIYKKALLVAGSVNSNKVNRPALSVANILSSLLREVEVACYPAFSGRSTARSAAAWLLREFSVLRKINRKKSIDLLVVHQMVALFGSFIAKKAGAKVIVYVGGSIYDGLRQESVTKRTLGLIHSYLWRLQLQFANLILIPTSDIMITSRLAVYSHKLKIAPISTLPILFSGQQIYRRRLPDRKNTIGYVGRFEIEKGVKKLPKIIKYTVQKRGIVDLQWLLIGDGTLKPYVENEIKSTGLSDYVQFTGWLEKPEEFLCNITLLVLPSEAEGLPNVVLEAMACGVPVLATRVGGITDLVTESKTGFLLNSADPAHIADRIVELLKMPMLLEKVSLTAYNWVRENYSQEKIIEIWRNALAELTCQ
jgi:glycosyltransferase involved in cell wall biosynthesis